MQSSSFTPSYPPKRIENTYPHKNLSKNVHSCEIRNSQNIEATQMPISWLIDKQNVAQWNSMAIKMNKFLIYAKTAVNLETWCSVKDASHRSHTV